MGGADAPRTPFFAAIQTDTKICGGAILAFYTVLTAASCVDSYVLLIFTPINSSLKFNWDLTSQYSHFV